MRFEGLALNLLVILDALLEEKSVTKASVRLNVSQPAVSAALAKLRWHTNDELLQKVGRNVELTLRAREMASSIKDILIQIKAVISGERSFDPKATGRQFRLAMSSYCAQVISPNLNRRLTQSYPNIRYVIESLSSDSVRRVKNIEIDICITSDQINLLNPSESLEDIVYSELFTDQWVLIADRETCDVSGTIEMEDFLTAPYVETQFNRNVTTLIEHSLSQMNASPRQVVRVPDFHLAVANVVGTRCISIVPSMLIDHNLLQKLQMQAPPFDVPPLHETLVWHARNDVEPGHKWFRELILEIGAEVHQSEPAPKPLRLPIHKDRRQPEPITLQ